MILDGGAQLGKILAVHHGFKCTVLFPIDPKTGEIKPDFQGNIPGLEALKTADLAIFALRFRNLPDDQMKHIDDYMKAGKPVIGMRTATHSFNGIKGDYAKYNFNANKATGWEQGWGRQILGETWIAHHGGHKSEATRGLIAPDVKTQDKQSSDTLSDSAIDDTGSTTDEDASADIEEIAEEMVIVSADEEINRLFRPENS